MCCQCERHPINGRKESKLFLDERKRGMLIYMYKYDARIRENAILKSVKNG